MSALISAEARRLILSISQVESFDREQKGGCETRFWLERGVAGVRPEQSDAQSDGEKGHALFTSFLRTGVVPAGRVKMGTAVRGAIGKGKLPKPGPDLLTEWRLSDQEKYDAAGNWIPLDVDAAPKIAGVPFDGFIDVSFRRGPVPELWDFKFYADIDQDAVPEDGAQPGETTRLLRTIQMPVYAYASIPFWPDATHWRLVHYYVNKTSVNKVPHSFLRWQIVTTAQIKARIVEIAAIVERIKVVSQAQTQEEVPFNRKACHAWWGCAHQANCSAFMENKMELSKEEKEALDLIENDSAVPAADDFDFETPAASEPTPPAEDDEIAKLEAQMAAAKAAKAKKEADAKAAAAKPPAPPAAPKRPNMQVQGDRTTIPPPAASSTTAPVEPTCKTPGCGAMLTPENASQLQSGAWVHIGCPKAPQTAAPAAPAPRARKTTGTSPAPEKAPELGSPVARLAQHTAGNVTITLSFLSVADAAAALALIGK